MMPFLKHQKFLASRYTCNCRSTGNYIKPVASGEDILEMVIANKKGKEAVAEWKQRLISKDYDTINHPRIGQLRKYWKEVYHFDLDNSVHPLLFRILVCFS